MQKMLLRISYLILLSLWVISPVAAMTITAYISGDNIVVDVTGSPSNGDIQLHGPLGDYYWSYPPVMHKEIPVCSYPDGNLKFWATQVLGGYAETTISKETTVVLTVTEPLGYVTTPLEVSGTVSLNYGYATVRVSTTGIYDQWVDIFGTEGDYFWPPKEASVTRSNPSFSFSNFGPLLTRPGLHGILVTVGPCKGNGVQEVREYFVPASGGGTPTAQDEPGEPNCY